MSRSERYIPGRMRFVRARGRNVAIDWRKALAKQTKAALLDALVELAQGDRRVARRIVAHFNLSLPLETLVEATRQAIADATWFDKREEMANRNFAYDHEAYETVRRNLQQLVDAGHFEHAMELSLEMVRLGSEQVEVSDEGLMTDDIADCLRPVINRLRSSDLPAATIIAWSRNMLQADCIGFNCEQELEAVVRDLNEPEATEATGK